MRIAQFISSLLAPLGGAEQYCLELARWQREQGHDVTILTGWASPGIVADLEAQGITVRVLPSSRPYSPDRKGSRPAAVLFHALDLLGAFRLPAPVRRALAEPWDAIHVHRFAGFGAAVLRAPRPVVMTVHDYGLVDTSTTLLRRGREAERPPLVQRLRTLVSNRAIRGAHLVFPTERLLQKHLAWGLVPASHSVLPHGWRLGGRVVPARIEHPAVFLFLGKVSEPKGVALLLEAWGAGIAGAELWIAGSGPLDEAVESAAAAGRVRRLGWLDEAGRRSALASASVLVAPSLWAENFPLTAAEGVLAGLPLLSTTIAAPPVLRDGVNGLLAEPDARSLRRALTALRDPELRSRYAAGSDDVARELDFDRHGARVLDLYAPAAVTA